MRPSSYFCAEHWPFPPPLPPSQALDRQKKMFLLVVRIRKRLHALGAPPNACLLFFLLREHPPNRYKPPWFEGIKWGRCATPFTTRCPRPRCGRRGATPPLDPFKLRGLISVRGGCSRRRRKMRRAFGGAPRACNRSQIRTTSKNIFFHRSRACNGGRGGGKDRGLAQ